MEFLAAIDKRGRGARGDAQFLRRVGPFSLLAGRLDDLTGACVRVISTEPLSPVARTALLEALMPLGGVLVQLGKAAPGSGPLLNVVEDETVMRSWLEGLGGQRFAIARPDHYVYGTAVSATDAVALLEQFHERLTRAPA